MLGASVHWMLALIRMGGTTSIQPRHVSFHIAVLNPSMQSAQLRAVKIISLQQRELPFEVLGHV